jgi:hypothetical protein
LLLAADLTLGAIRRIDLHTRRPRHRVYRPPADAHQHRAGHTPRHQRSAGLGVKG